ncbi:MAG: hydrogenase iron-sulfur subunit [Theionarchaea archaeon]|nr:hydrogenase iron-sulfur subunit [Theionarchaea archaeon]MBU7038770.1 hydrogenase iron-sulfur subunit [Theionarchaea archaeon]
MRIVAFVCNWCARAGVELAAYERIGYPDVGLIYVNCTGRIDVQLILQTLEKVDGVVICACHLGDDHYGSGNYKTLKKVLLTKKILAQLGINPERVCLEWISSTEAEKLGEAVKKMKETLEEMTS